jgi:hypothetical protein
MNLVKPKEPKDGAKHEPFVQQTGLRPREFVECKSDLSSITKCDPDSNCDNYEFGQTKLELSMRFCSTSKSDLSSTTKCDQNHICDYYEFGHT